MPTYLDVYVLQSVPPSNLNRDDSGSPKQGMYGGVNRSRVSSQAWKRATRRKFEDTTARKDLGVRTKQISAMLAEQLSARGKIDLEAATPIATSVLSQLDIKPGKKATETAYLLFFGRSQVERFVDAIETDLPHLLTLSGKDLDKAVGSVPVMDILRSGHPIDVALFGRMVAEIPHLNVDAACQVAHALSTHAVEPEFDYYTAVDDEKEAANETGAGMIGTIEFTSSTLYRYATVGIDQLLENLDGDLNAVEHALRSFVTAFVTSMPTGHQNSFGHHTAPDLVSLAVRDDQPVNLVSAFEAPVTSNGSGHVAASVLRLADEMRAVQNLWGLTPLAAATCYNPDLPGLTALTPDQRDTLGKPMSFADVVDTGVAAAIEPARDLIA